MSELGTFELTHPELLSETELRAILKNACIDFSKYEKLCRSELIETYKQLAMPLPQRRSEAAKDSKQSPNKRDSTEDKDSSQQHSKSRQSNRPCNLKRNFNEESKSTESNNEVSSKSPKKDVISPSKKICVNTSRSIDNWNGSEKQATDEKNENSPTKKRQKITWP